MEYEIDEKITQTIKITLTEVEAKELIVDIIDLQSEINWSATEKHISHPKVAKLFKIISELNTDER